jgi:hypothetical protein
MAKSTHDQNPPGTASTVTTVIYDRLATPSRAFLDVRLTACREYAAECGWSIVAEHTDTGEAALHDRTGPGQGWTQPSRTFRRRRTRL